MGFLMGLGGRFRKPVWTNLALCVFVVLYWLMFSLVVLPDSNAYTKLFHFPSENYNVPGTTSSTWSFYNGYDAGIAEACVNDNTNGTATGDLTCDEMSSYR